jgi:hypothetical protein
MKKVIAFFFAATLLSCGNNADTGDSNTDSGAQTEIGGVENVNGNIPDTTATGGTPTSGSNAKPIDSSYADTSGAKTR